MGKYIPGRIAGDQKVADKWAKYASDNSYKPTAADKAGGKPKMQGPQGRMTGRDTRANCGPIGTYPGSKDDRMSEPLSNGHDKSEEIIILHDAVDVAGVAPMHTGSVVLQQQ